MKHTFLSYETVLPYRGRTATLSLRDGRQFRGEIVDVTPTGILFGTPNPGLLFFPFFAIGALALATLFFI